MNEIAQCPQCGTPLPAGGLDGLCPNCLLKQGAAADTGTPPASAPFHPPPLAELARLFPQLELISLLGQGGMGAVYQARQPALDRVVALKILPPQAAGGPAFAERFNREARALARLSHPNIVGVHEFGQAGELHYFIMEFVDGVNLRQLEQAGRLSPREALQIIPQICDALQYAHDEGVVHRDIKPENVLVDRKGRVKIADFGLAKILDREAANTRLTGEGQVMGTPHYMAPEQVERPLEVDHRADIYSLGVVFYEMLTGELPLGKFAPPSNKVRVDVRLDDVVLHALEKEPARRYQHASEVKTDVQNITSSAPPQKPPMADTAAVAGGPALEAIERQVRGPAIGLLVVGILNWILIPLAVLLFLPRAAAANNAGFPQSAVVAFGLLPLVLCSFIIVAALRMKRLEGYALAIVASVLAILVTPGNIGGLPIGIWALVVLLRREVREAFAARAAAATRRPNGGSRDQTQRLTFAGVLLWLPPLVFAWFVLFGDWLFGVDMDADVRFYVGLVGFPITAALGAMMAWLVAREWDAAPADAAAMAGRKWSGLALASAVALIGSLPLGGGAMVMLQLIAQDPDWHPGAGEAALSLGLLGGAGLLAAGATVFGVVALRQIRQAAGRLRGRLAALAATWFWPALAAGIVGTAVVFPEPIIDSPQNVEARLRGLDELKRKQEEARLREEQASLRRMEEEKQRENERAGAAAELWAPPVHTREWPALTNIYQDALDLAAEGRHEEALQRHIWYHNHALGFDPGLSGVRLSFALSAWAELGRKYPKARQAMLAMRNQKASKFREGRGSFDLFHDVVALNHYLPDEDATVALFKTLVDRDPELASQCYIAAEDLLVKKGEYALCLSFIPDCEEKFDDIRRAWEADQEMAPDNPQMDRPDFRKVSEDRFLAKTCQLIEILVANGRLADAENIRGQAAALCQDSRMKSAVNEAGKRIGK